MERIGKIGWFLTDEEYERISNAITVIQEILDTAKCEQGHSDDLTLKPGETGGTIPVNPCPSCPWNQPYKPWVNPADWTVRPEHLPWYGPGEPISPNDWRVGDGEWWKHQPYCTSTTDDNPNTVKETKTFNSESLSEELAEKLRKLSEKKIK